MGSQIGRLRPASRLRGELAALVAPGRGLAKGLGLLVVVVWAGGCTGAPPSSPPSQSAAARVVPSDPAQGVRETEQPSGPATRAMARGSSGDGGAGARPLAGTPCGSLGCRLFDTPEAAFRHILARTEPVVLAIGEAHAQRGTEGVESATRRFTRMLLPELEGRASDLVVELMLPPSGCDEQKQAVGSQQKQVTERQKEGTQSEYVALGHRARALGIVPDALRPSCDDLKAVARAGPDGVIEMLKMIQRLTEQEMRRRVERNREMARSGMVVAYGGAMHNDLAPRPGREDFSFGPALAELLGSRYVELDLIVPQFIKDTEAWRALPFYSAFDPEAHPDQTTVYEPHPRSYVLIFPVRPGS